MAKDTNMLDYIGDKMDALDFDGDLDLNWDKEAHVFEVELTMYVDAAAGFEVEDQDGQTVTDGNEVDYSDAILFYDETRLNGADYADNYLATFGFAGKKGIEQAKVDALFSYLQELLDDGQSDLFDFVDGTSDAETFELTFDQAKFDAAYAAQPAAAKATAIPYPKY
ncbi:DUF3013 family protein [Lacticaseibacillus daqingensis]|uniref:DUF3013 family protein n=1 Tax=Lacticaseibacillus daqingensis TaxID=2486014 RepID=UPI000F797462|nr:DUF3013 family protein [Lacticaseibacillus daqingensis]